ncbi:hypothetical protein DFQ09_1263 [Winogradskyella pacifica]|uniref:Uncharacterized protein n=1 Tax=Winogradskyella pacifica TaxID=664642 RepID=A0A3D9LI56_9FLAO|nr:hypothetical protein [Winogradskyella pacifica]REE06935.1 hypothetical protein DFQ09_1263 [Winogradskyella pacifica]
MSEKLNTFTNTTNSANPDLLARDVYNAELDFTIDTDVANYIEYGAYHSYTFPVYRTTDNGLIENLLLSLQNDGNYKAYLITYNLTEQEKEQIQNGITIDLEGKIETTVLQDQNWVNSNFAAKGIYVGGNGADCVDIITTTRSYCQDKNFNWQIDNGQLDNGCRYNFGTQHTTTTLSIDADCLSGGGGGGSTGTGTGDGNGSGNGTGTGTGTGGGGTGGSNNDGSGSTGTGNTGNNTDPDNGNGNAETEPCLQLTENGDCVDDTTVLIIGEIELSNERKLKKITNKANVKTKIIELKTESQRFY